MACDQLDEPFWVRHYFIRPVAQAAEGGGADCCVQYKIHISTPKPAAPGEPEQVGGSPAPPAPLSRSCYRVPEGGRLYPQNDEAAEPGRLVYSSGRVNRLVGGSRRRTLLTGPR